MQECRDKGNLSDCCVYTIRVRVPASTPSVNCGVEVSYRVDLPKGGLEPPRVTSHAPQTCASTSSATSAYSKIKQLYFVAAGDAVVFAFVGAGAAAFGSTDACGLAAGAVDAAGEAAGEACGVAPSSGEV